MSRLLTIVNERKKLRNEYRKILEDSYIESKKAEEKALAKEKNDKARENKEPFLMTEDEVKEMMIKKSQKL